MGRKARAVLRQRQLGGSGRDARTAEHVLVPPRSRLAAVGTYLGRRSHRGGAKRRSRRAAVAGRWYPRVTLGDGGAPRVRPATREKCTGKPETACCFSARKRLLLVGRVSRPIYGGSAYNQYADPKHNLCWYPSLTELKLGQTAAGSESPAALQGPAVTGPGRSRAAGRRGRRAGRSVPIGNLKNSVTLRLFFPSHYVPSLT
jgi:hypothetical protein